MASAQLNERYRAGVSAGHSVLITGPTGAGKSWLACALAQHACRRGYSALYQRVPRLPEELRIRHGSGAFGKWLIQLARTDVLVLDDWGIPLTPLPQGRNRLPALCYLLHDAKYHSLS